MAYDPEEEARWAVHMRLTDLEDDVAELRGGPYVCPFCQWPYNTKAARDHCDCDDD